MLENNRSCKDKIKKHVLDLSSRLNKKVTGYYIIFK